MIATFCLIRRQLLHPLAADDYFRILDGTWFNLNSSVLIQRFHLNRGAQDGLCRGDELVAEDVGVVAGEAGVLADLDFSEDVAGSAVQRLVAQSFRPKDSSLVHPRRYLSRRLKRGHSLPITPLILVCLLHPINRLHKVDLNGGVDVTALQTTLFDGLNITELIKFVEDFVKRTIVCFCFFASECPLHEGIPCSPSLPTLLFKIRLFVCRHACGIIHLTRVFFLKRLICLV